MKWEQSREAFEIDGSLRDIYVQDTTVADWEWFLSFIRDYGFEFRYTRNGEEAEMPSFAADVLNDATCSHGLKIYLDDIVVACHFFTDEEIELDIDPREVTSQTELDLVLNFLRLLGTRLSKDTILTPENLPQAVWLKYSWRNDEFELVPEN